MDHLQSKQFQIPNEHRDAILGAIEHYGNQGITFSPTSTDYTDETGKTHRVPVHLATTRRIDIYKHRDSDNQTYSFDQELPTESHNEVTYYVAGDKQRGVGQGMAVHNWQDGNQLHGRGGLFDISARDLRQEQLAAADRADSNSQPIKEVEHLANRMAQAASERKMVADHKVGGFDPHTPHHLNVNVYDRYDSSLYKYDTRTGNIHEREAFTDYAKMPIQRAIYDQELLQRSQFSGTGSVDGGTPTNQHLRSFDA
jgi:hypothetical protein